MVKVRKDLTGKTFGRLTVLRQVDDFVLPDGRHRAQWLCECSCAQHNTVVVVGDRLKSGMTKSCGCISKELASQQLQNNRKYNAYDPVVYCDEYGEYMIGYCSNTNNKFYFDAEDYELIKQYCWRENVSRKYHELTTRNITSTKHLYSTQNIRFSKIINCENYDHIDKNPLNNRKYNLRQCTFRENMYNRGIRNDNTSGVTGVYFEKQSNKWKAQITSDGIKKYLGRFDNKDDAIKARLLAEQKYFKDFAPQKHLNQKFVNQK